MTKIILCDAVEYSNPPKKKMIDPLNEFFEFDATMGVDAVKCPHCGADVSRSLFLDDEVECPERGKTFKKKG